MATATNINPNGQSSSNIPATTLSSSSSSSRQRKIRMANMQNELLVLQELPRESVSRYMVLKQRRSARQIQIFYRQQKYKRTHPQPSVPVTTSQLFPSSTTNNHTLTTLSTNQSTLHGPTSTSLMHQTNNSLFISALPSTIEDALSESSNSGLLDITFATTDVSAITTGDGERSNNVTSTNILPPSLSHTTQPRALRSINTNIKETYSTLMEPSKLIDLQHTIMAKTIRKQQGIPEENLKFNNKETNPTMNNLARMRDRSDNLLYKHLRNRSKYGNTPEEIHNRRLKLIKKIETLTVRLGRPAKPSEVLMRALNHPKKSSDLLPTTGETSFMALSSSDEEDTVTGLTNSAHNRELRRQQSIQHDLNNKNIENIPPTLSSAYKEALGVVRWPSTMSDTEKLQAYQTHRAAMEALSSHRHWYQVHAANELQTKNDKISTISTTATMDIREINPQPLWPWDNEIIRTNPKLSSLLITNPNQSGWKALTLQNYLPPKVKEAIPICKVSPEDATTLALESLQMNKPSSTSDDPGKAGVPTPTFPTVYAFQQNKDTMHKVAMSDSEASQWWLSFVCGNSPLYSQIQPVPGGSPSSTRHQTIIQETLQYVTKQGPLAKLDMSIGTATKELEVVDPWSTAAAYMDPGVVTSAVRSACAAAMVHEKDTPSMGIGSATTENTKSVSTSIEDLLNMSTELAAAPPLDYYATNGINMSEDELSLRRLVGNSNTKPTAGLLPAAFATPAESITARVKVAYDAIQRRLAAESANNEPGSMALLTREVAARKIQRCWRGSNIIRIARRELLRRKQGLEQAAATRGAAMTAAISQFMAALEATTGVELGSSVLAEQLNQLTTSNIYGKGSTTMNRDLTTLLSANSKVKNNNNLNSGWNKSLSSTNTNLPPRPDTAIPLSNRSLLNTTTLNTNRPRTSSFGTSTTTTTTTTNNLSSSTASSSYLRYTEVKPTNNNGTRSQRNSITNKGNSTVEDMNLPTVAVHH